MEKKCMVYVARNIEDVLKNHEEIWEVRLKKAISSNPEWKLTAACLFVGKEDEDSPVFANGKPVYIGTVDESADCSDAVEALSQMLGDKGLSEKGIERVVEQYSSILHMSKMSESPNWDFGKIGKGREREIDPEELRAWREDLQRRDVITENSQNILMEIIQECNDEYVKKVLTYDFSDITYPLPSYF